MTQKEFTTWTKGKSKTEVEAILPKDTTVTVFTTGKGKIATMSVMGGEWKLYATLAFDKDTQRVK